MVNEGKTPAGGTRVLPPVGKLAVVTPQVATSLVARLLF